MTKRWRRIVWFLLGAAGTALFLAVLYWLLSGAGASQNAESTTDLIRDTQVSNHELLDTIRDCTQTGGQCHERGLKQTAAAVASITQRATANAACQIILSRQAPDATAQQLYAQINRCADETLALLKRQRDGR